MNLMMMRMKIPFLFGFSRCSTLCFFPFSLLILKKFPSKGESFSFSNPIILFSSKRKTRFLSFFSWSVIVSIINYSLGMCEFIFCFREISSLLLSSSLDWKRGDISWIVSLVWKRWTGWEVCLKGMVMGMMVWRRKMGRRMSCPSIRSISNSRISCCWSRRCREHVSWTGSKGWQWMGRDESSWITEHVTWLLSLLPLCSTVLEPNLIEGRRRIF